ncbi:MAG: leucine--tRNA ligase, partial [Cyanobacteria bacterium P01_F01_bin.42]
VKTMQANWIGKSVGAYLEFEVVGEGQKIGVFTTRPDTVFGVSYVVLAPEHPLTLEITTDEQRPAVEAFIAEVAASSELERTAEDKPKKGVATGARVKHPFTGEEVPVWIADYVLYEYGTGAVMGVPAHDTRDFKFASDYDLPIQQVIAADPDNLEEKLSQAFTDPGILINSGDFNGQKSTDAKANIIKAAAQKGCGQERVQYRLRDWLISRQRYWGVPIPVIHCPNCGTVPVADEDLPVQLPEDVEFSGKGASPLSQLGDWVNVTCPSCQKPAKRETDTMDTFIDSSWYFLRYPDANNDENAFTSSQVNDWLPVDQYVGGIEHAILHLLYSRFFTKVLRDRGLINVDEPFKKLLTQGMVQSITYKNPETGKYIAPDNISNPDNPVDPDTGDKLEVFFEKMSKSKYNGIPPEFVIDKYGADTARLFTLFKAPPEKDLEWDEADVEGQYRFLNRVWRLASEFATQRSDTSTHSETLSKEEKALRRAVHVAIDAVSKDLSGDYQFNTAVSELMKLSNALSDAKCRDSSVFAEGIDTLLLLMAPFAPHIAEELWSQQGHQTLIHQSAWPEVDESALEVDEITLVIQIMGKTRGKIQVPSQATKEELEQYAIASDIGQRYVAGKTIRKVIVVPGKLINFVVS